MSDLHGYYDRVADQQIRERVAQRQQLSVRPRRLRGRHGLARRLHQIAERLDG